MPPISTSLSGRYGNQLFIVAAAAAVARDTNRILHIYSASGEEAKITLACVDAGMQKINKCARIFECKRLFRGCANENGGALAYDDIKVPPKTFLHINGYRQHYKYFSRYNDWILNSIFSIPSRRTQTLREFGLPSLAGKICIHVRRGDYASQSNLYSFLPIASDCYYVEALKQMAEKSGLVDAIMFCEEESRANVQATLWPLLQRAVPYVNIAFAPLVGAAGKKHNSWHEMLWMSTASNFIIANSTFSWWSAWMSPAAPSTKIVIIPKEWAGLCFDGDVREMGIPDPTENFGLWLRVSNRKMSTDTVMCSQGDAFASRTCSVADEYELAPYDESVCGHLDRDFTFCGESQSRRKVCPPSFCIIDSTGEPLPGPHRTFTSFEQFLQSAPFPCSWIVVRKDTSITFEHIFNDLWYVMQPKRFRLDTDPTHNCKYVLRRAQYNKHMFIIAAASLRATQVPSLAWWDERYPQWGDELHSFF